MIQFRCRLAIVRVDTASPLDIFLRHFRHFAMADIDATMPPLFRHIAAFRRYDTPAADTVDAV